MGGCGRTRWTRRSPSWPGSSALLLIRLSRRSEGSGERRCVLAAHGPARRQGAVDEVPRFEHIRAATGVLQRPVAVAGNGQQPGPGQLVRQRDRAAVLVLRIV